MTTMPATAIVLAMTIAACGPGRFARADPLEVQRLNWAGVKFVYGDTTVLIDAVGGEFWNNEPPEGLAQVVIETSRRYALLTHVHNDHFDAETLKRVLGERGTVICHESAAVYVASRGLRVTAVSLYEPLPRGDFVFTAVPASDGFDDEQVSWIVTVDGKRYFHGGDTLWHGQWQTIASAYAPFEAAFLPINGARIQADPMPEAPGVLTPAQAVDAGMVLRARTIVPIHYGGNDPPAYVEVENPLSAFRNEADRRGVQIVHLLPGQALDP